MTRRDIIIMAVLVNAGLLGILFMMAITSDDNKLGDAAETSPTAAMEQPAEIPLNKTEITFIPAATGDEGDNALKEFAASPSIPQTVVIEEETVQDMDQDDDMAPKPEAEPATTTPETEAADKKYVQVTVKRGDSLDKIARANGTTIKAIKDANQLTTDRLKIGQELKVPVSDKKSSSKAAQKPKQTDTKQLASADGQYYTIKNGDNPWKIAKQFNLKLDDLLKLNNMDEDKARNLKPGDKIKIK